MVENSFLSLLFFLVNIVYSSNGQQYSSINLGPVNIEWLNSGSQTSFIATLNTTSININDAWFAKNT